VAIDPTIGGLSWSDSNEGSHIEKSNTIKHRHFPVIGSRREGNGRERMGGGTKKSARAWTGEACGNSSTNWGRLEREEVKSERERE